jgi:hypothetical protein
MKAYSLNEHDLNFAGIDLDDARGKVTLKPTGKRFSFKTGIDGATTMSENKGNDNHTAEVELEYGSSANAKLSAFYNLVKAGGGSLNVAPFVLKDRNGTSFCSTLEASITGWPDRERAAESGVIVWEFYLVQPDVFEGGLGG